jgi:hypothetical protein
MKNFILLRNTPSFLAVATVVLTITTICLTTFTIDINMTCPYSNLQYQVMQSIRGVGIRIYIFNTGVATMHLMLLVLINKQLVLL